MTEHEVYQRILVNIERYGWGQGTRGVFCIEGHINYALAGTTDVVVYESQLQRLQAKVRQRLRKFTGGISLITYNDYHCTTKLDIIALVKKGLDATAPPALLPSSESKPLRPWHDRLFRRTLQPVDKTGHTFNLKE